MTLYTQMCEATMDSEGIEAILIHPERAAELYRELSEWRWYNTETGAVLKGMPSDRGDDGSIIHVGAVPVFEDRHLPLYTFERKAIAFFVKRKQADGTMLEQGCARE